MKPELYQQAKTLFTELVELDDASREEALLALSRKSPDVAQEVRSLLGYHSADSLVVSPASPKIRTRSTLSTTYQTRSWGWLSGPARCLLIAVPLFLAAIALSVWADRHVHDALQTAVSSHLRETIDSRVVEFRQWERQTLEQALSWSRHPAVVADVRHLVAIAETQLPDTPELRAELLAAPFAKNLGRQLQRLSGAPIKFALWDRRMQTIADWDQDNKPEVLSEFVTPSNAALLAPVLKGNATLYLPKLQRTLTEGYKPVTYKPVLAVFVPIYDTDADSGNVVAALLIRGYGVEQQYRDMLDEWFAKSAGETYLINRRGALLTKSRYADRLDSIDLAIDNLGVTPAPLVRDPGVSLFAGRSPNGVASAWPPTLLARQLTSGNNGLNVDGYRNYVGERVVGAWHWLPDHAIGIAIEQSHSDAFRIASFVRNSILATAALFTIGLVGLSFGGAMGSLRRRKLRDVSEVGPYQIQELLGEGGMGRVYLAEHALLCRQSAVKVLTKGTNDLSAISRFEREVQLASQLTHPNTISIYDFGRNRDGLFYYAMEYINGAHLGQLVEYSGPIPPGRCIYIIRQLCRALMEAHQAGVVHRDIKPQNIMVCNRGGEPDFVKLFDYGLVKAFAPGVSHHSSQTKIVVGTPRFMAPERLNSPWLADPRVDVYSVGALAYYLLTAKLPPLVSPSDTSTDEPADVETLDLPPSVVDFGEILSVCMSVELSTRPSNMHSLLRSFEVLSDQFPWSRDDSLQWWDKHETKLLHLVRNKRKKLDDRSEQTT